jgi:hypothetical protein
VSGWVRIGVAWRDDGLWTLLWWIGLSALKRGRSKTLVPEGFVGRVLLSYQGIGPVRLKVLSLSRQPPKASTYGVRLWRLICALETHQPHSRLSQSGGLSDRDGSSWADGGADGSTRLTRITSIYRNERM